MANGDIRKSELRCGWKTLDWGNYMASCTSCGAELTGDFCSQCGAPATAAARRRRMRRVIKWVLVSIGWLLGVMLVVAIVVPLFEKFSSGPGTSAEVAERETVQTAIEVFMVDNDLSKVTPSTSGVGGEKIVITSTQFHPTINLSHYLWDYMEQYSTRFCYRWDADGRITFQYDVGAATGRCLQLYP